MIDELHPAGRTASYQLPAGKATDIFRRIIAPHAGKVLFIDFWGIYCGPCRGGIQATADLQREFNKYLDSFRSIVCYAAQIYGFYHEISRLTDNMEDFTRQVSRSTTNALAVALST